MAMLNYQMGTLTHPTLHGVTHLYPVKPEPRGCGWAQLNKRPSRRTSQFFFVFGQATCWICRIAGESFHFEVRGTHYLFNEWSLTASNCATPNRTRNESYDKSCTRNFSISLLWRLAQRHSRQMLRLYLLKAHHGTPMCLEESLSMFEVFESIRMKMMCPLS